MEYIVKDGQGILDVVLGGAGDISEWGNIIEANSFDTWTPDLKAGQVIIIPNKIRPGISLGNGLIPYNLIDSLETTLDAVVPVEFPPPAEVEQVFEYYKVRDGETITDVILNSTGDFANWNDILNLNEFEEWVPELTSGQKIKTNGIIKQNNNVKLFKSYPICNSKVSDLEDQITDLINKFAVTILFDDDEIEMLFDDDGVTALYN